MTLGSATTYATLKNLDARLTKENLMDYHHVVVKDERGRYTAIFRYSSVGQDCARIARLGFMVLG